MMPWKILPLAALPAEPDWLLSQPCPVLAYGEGSSELADVIVENLAEAEKLAARIAQWPQAALLLVQVLRANERLPVSSALDMESMAYSTLQCGDEFARWRREQQVSDDWPECHGDALLLAREGNVLHATLNRPTLRNSMTVAMRDAWMAALDVLEADPEIVELRFSANGDCFSVGGELREFGSSPDAATAHWVRTVHSPARRLYQLRDRIRFTVHGACLGSGIELPAFAGTLLARRKSFFQLPELPLGLIPGAGGTVSIARRIGRQRAAWLVLSGRRINVKTALDWGLIDGIVDEETG